MIKVLIVDNDTIERKTLRNLINWDSVNALIVGEAQNGKQGLEMAMALKPDIIITNIRMPIMDGIKMARKVMGVMPNTEIIICTEYEDFGYANEVMDLNVFGYILKPANTEELLLMVKNASKKSIENRLQSQLDFKIGDYSSKIANQLKRVVCNEILTGNSDWEMDILESLQLDWLTKNKNCLGIILSYGSVFFNNSKAELHQLETMLTRENKNIVIMQSPINDICILFEIGNIENAKQKVNSLIQIVCNSVSVDIHPSENIFSAYGIADSKNINQLLHKAFEPYTCRLVPHNKQNKDVTGLFSTRDIMDILKSKDEDKLQFLINNYINLHNSEDEKLALQNLTIRGVVRFYECIIKSELTAFQNIDNLLQCMIKLYDCKNIEDLKRYFSDYVKEIFLSSIQYTCKNDYKNDLIVRNVLEIITTQYNERLTVVGIAKNYYFSSNYIGSLFKIYTKKSIKEYISKFRVCKAMELLTTSSLSSASIANMCGFENIPYFHNSFKKHTGRKAGHFKKGFLI